MNKKIVWLGSSVGGIVGGLIGYWIDKGNGLGLWSIVLSMVGGLLGIYAAYKLGIE